MSAGKWLSAAVAFAGAAMGSFVDTERAAAPAMAGGYHVVAADFHVHAFPGDGALPPWELAREASRRGLHAIVVSNHNQTLSARRTLPGWVFPVAGPLVIPAQEVTTPRFHLIAAGIRETIDWRLPEDAIVRAIHAQGGVIIAAHPVEQSWRGSDALLAAVDGIEVAHPLTGTLEAGRAELDAFYARARRVNPDVAPIGSSDFHRVAPLGACRTYVFAEAVTAEGVLDAIRAGRTVAEDQDGRFYGDPALVSLVNEAGIKGREGRPKLALAFALVVLMGFAGFMIDP
ncbi:MAG TPA: CehA/McbA family metallohydrolase [Vicinamibacterales bacterium]|nr:CehA/McbA family metallohydrolase [Vicinamibacterales bacterium]